MPGRSPAEAVDAFLGPLKEAVRCIGSTGFALSTGARGDVGETHTWALNWGQPIALGDGFQFDASMYFETLDQGASRRSERFRVSTRAYLYSVKGPDGSELISAHWHPTGKSHETRPHWHLGSAAISPDGVFLERAHIPSPRISFEHMIRWIIESIPGVDPAVEDWDRQLERTESTFEQFKSW